MSNDNTVISELSKNKSIPIIENKYDTILKNLNKYKLPELQDFAIEYKLGLNIGNKNKNKNQLINEIKNFILNKNI